jgi:hypothetical protein
MSEVKEPKGPKEPKEDTEKKARSTRRGWMRDHGLSLSGTVIALCALALSVTESVERRNHDRLSVRPHLDFGRSHSTNPKKPKLEYYWVNNGLGPAYFRWLRVEVDGHALRTWAEFTKQLALPNPGEFTWYVPSEDAAIRTNLSRTLFKTINAMNVHSILNTKKKINLSVCYCSAYEECWVTKLDAAPEAVASCEGVDNSLRAHRPDTRNISPKKPGEASVPLAVQKD